MKPLSLPRQFQSFVGLLQRQDAMPPARKAGLVAAGYLGALIVAATGVTCHLIAVGGPNSPNYGGPSAFGDFLLFFALFGIASVPATSAAFVFLRSRPAFWRLSSIAALLLAVLGLAASVAVIVAAGSVVGAMGFLLVLAAPLLTVAFGLSGYFSPDRASRMALYAAGITEGASFAVCVTACLLRNL